MQWSVLGAVLAEGDLDALRQFREAAESARKKNGA
jgi:hypothetical protein